MGGVPAYVPAGGGWEPTDLTSLQVWLDASDTTTITHSSGAVSQWDDKSGNSRHYAQATSSLQPITGTRTLNGLNVIDFDGVDDRLTRTLPAIAQPINLAIVFQRDAITQDKLFAAGLNILYLTTDNTVWRLGNATLLSFSGSANDTNAHTVVATYNGTSSTLRLDGSTLVTGNTGTTGISAANSAIGGRYDNGEHPMNGVYGDLIIWTGTDAGELSDVETYCSTKWGTP